MRRSVSGSAAAARAARSPGPRAGARAPATCSSASLYSACASGLTGPSCSRRRCRRSIGVCRCARSSSASASSAGSGSSPSLSASAGELGLGVLRVVAGALRLDLAAGDRLAALAQLRVDARLLGGALAQLVGQLLAGRPVGVELGLEHLDAVGDRRLRRSSAAAKRSATGLSASVALRARRRSCSSRRARVRPARARRARPAGARSRSATRPAPCGRRSAPRRARSGAAG